ncbi:MAG: matrixin family metalloprotease [Planctomycetes bacterium]|nr:matrixin family metalloprotease [Planctomycetota bacterium]
MSPGGASWSPMPSGVEISGLRPDDMGDHPAGTSTDIEFLITAAVDGLEYSLFDAAFDVWAAAANITNLGQVTDGGSSALAGGLESTGSQLGDIRVAGYQFGASPTQFGVLAHAYIPLTEALAGPGNGGTIGGDIHFDTAELWSDDENDTLSDQDIDFFTVALHELGHSLGLGHSSVAGSVMVANYTGGRRTLGPDDIAGIQAIYGVPEPSAFLFGCLLVGVGVVAKWKKMRFWEQT